MCVTIHWAVICTHFLLCLHALLRATRTHRLNFLIMNKFYICIVRLVHTARNLLISIPVFTHIPIYSCVQKYNARSRVTLGIMSNWWIYYNDHNNFSKIGDFCFVKRVLLFVFSIRITVKCFCRMKNWGKHWIIFLD